MKPKLFSELGLSPELLKAVDKLGFEQASPIQAESIPVLMQGHDIVGQSQTGSGKTAAFGIPAIEKVDPQQRSIQILILCPTRELAVQVSEEVHKLALFKRGVQALPIYGGQSYERQFLGLRQGAQIVIGTPGRVMDHMRRGTIRFDAVKMVILDEADVMLNMGFREDIELILQAVPKERQTVFFSATFPKPIQDLIQKHSRNPQTIRIEQQAMTVPTVEQAYYEVDRRFKIELLTRLIDLHDLKLGIIFCNTKRMVDDLVDHLNAQGYSADRLHGDMNQTMRDRVMNKFRKSGLEFLVATDVAARGIDVDDVQVVFNYDLPYDPEDYLHRIGRTGRAGKSGRAISFVAGRELFQIQNIERFTKTKIHRAKAPTAAEVEEARAELFVDKLRGALRQGDFKKHDRLIERLLEEGFSSTDISSALISLLQTADNASSAPANPKQENASPPPSERPYRESSRRDAPREYSNPRRENTGPSSPSRARFDSPRTREKSAPWKRDPSRERESRPSRPSSPADHSAPRPPRSVESRPVPPIAETPVTPKPAPENQPAPKPADSPRAEKINRRTPDDMVKLFVNAGSEMGIEPADVVGAIMGETGLPASTVGKVDLRERHLFVDVTSAQARIIISKLNRTTLKGRRVKVKEA